MEGVYYCTSLQKEQSNWLKYLSWAIPAINFTQIVSSIHSLLSPYIDEDEIIGDHQCRFRLNRSTTDQIFYIRQIQQRKMGV
jgi:hypothetical protein